MSLIHNSYFLYDSLKLLLAGPLPVYLLFSLYDRGAFDVDAIQQRIDFMLYNGYISRVQHQTDVLFQISFKGLWAIYSIENKL